MHKYVKAVALAGAVTFAAMLSSTAQANTLTFYNDAATQDTERFTLECSLGCLGWDGTGFSAPDGDLFSLANNSEALEILTVNALTGGSFVSLIKTDMGGSDFASFTSSAMYLLIKIGRSPDVTVILNTFVDNVFTFTQTGKGAGFSHVSEFGENIDISPDPIPLPGGIVLLLSALAGLAGLARMRKTAARA